MLTAAEVWSRLLDRAKRDLPEQTFRTWLEPAEPLAIDDGTLVVGTPDRFAAEWNESKHSGLLASYAPVALGHPVQIVFKVHEERKARPQMDLFVAPPPPAAPAAAEAAAAVAPSPGGAAAWASQLNERYTFDNFVPGKSNELAFATANAIVEQPGKLYNPFFIYGESGLGKTHLMQAVAHDILRRTPRTRVLFVGTEQFTNEMVRSIRERTQPEFRRRFRETDLLLIDDVQFLKGKEATQEEFFHTFNAIYEAGRQIILTSDRPPKEIPGLESRLVSRFEWGMVTDIKEPDYEHRIAILQKKVEVEHLAHRIPDEVLEFVARHVRSNVRELEGSVLRLLAYASLKKADVSVDLAREALRDKIRAGDEEGEGAPGLTLATVQQAVAREWGVSVDGLRSKTRTQTLTVPRQVAMYLIRELLGVQLVQIGAAFGGRDHSTVLHSIGKTEATLAEDAAFAARVSKVRELLTQLRS